MNVLKLGIPKGSLEKSTIALFEKSGWKISVNSRSYFPDINDKTIQCSILRAQEMSRYVENGTIDVGLTGKDWIEENKSDIVVVDDLVYSKVSQNPARWVLAVPADSDIKELKDLQGKKIARARQLYSEVFQGKKYKRGSGVFMGRNRGKGRVRSSGRHCRGHGDRKHHKGTWS